MTQPQPSQNSLTKGEAAAAEHRRRSFETWLYDLLGHQDHPDSMTGPPMEGYGFRWREDGCDKVAVQIEDGAELWFGYPDEWRFHMDLPRARRLAVWLLWVAIKDGFGLRTRAWYWLLHRRCARNRP
jgi:hypothetical protein